MVRTGWSFVIMARKRISLTLPKTYQVMNYPVFMIH
jgi:hypothetical protein